MSISIKQVPAESVEQLIGKVPHKVYDLSLDRITRSEALDGVTFSGWRFLLQDEAGQFHVAEVAVTKDGGYAFRRIEAGGDTNAFASVYDSVHVHDLVQAYHYEITYLRVPSCGVMAIWLRGDDHHHEMMIPLVTIQPDLEAGVSYSAREFMHIVEGIARERIMQEDMHIAIDDLRRIEGIGPKIAELLMEAGIFTFSHLAETDSEKLREVLQGGGSRYNRANPTTWAEQAALARDGKWAELETLQDELKGGRRAGTADTEGEEETDEYDDLTIIKGIDRSMERYLRQNPYERLAGVPTFKVLAKIYPGDIAEVLNEETVIANGDLIDSWPKQAKLAAAGKWDELEKYKNTLPDWVDGPYDPQ